MWNSYDKWLKDHARYLWQCWRLGFEAFTEFKYRTGLSTEYDRSVLEDEGWYHEGCMQKLVEAAVEYAKTGSSKIVESLRDDDSSMVADGTGIAFSKSQETRTKVKNAFARIAKDLGRSKDAKEVAAAIPDLKKRADAIRRQFEMIRVMGFIEGTCEACRAYSS